jgi:hypothetical protein
MQIVTTGNKKAAISVCFEGEERGEIYVLTHKYPSIQAEAGFA